MKRIASAVSKRLVIRPPYGVYSNRPSRAHKDLDPEAGREVEPEKKLLEARLAA